MICIKDISNEDKQKLFAELIKKVKASSSKDSVFEENISVLDKAIEIAQGSEEFAKELKKLEDTKLAVKMDENDYQHPVGQYNKDDYKGGSSYTKIGLVILAIAIIGGIVAKKKNLY